MLRSESLIGPNVMTGWQRNVRSGRSANRRQILMMNDEEFRDAVRLREDLQRRVEEVEERLMRLEAQRALRVARLGLDDLDADQ